MVSVRIPSQLRILYGCRPWEPVEAATVAAAIAALDERYPGLGERLTEPGGRLRRWVNVFVDGQDVRALAGLETGLAEGGEMHIVPSVAGGEGEMSRQGDK